MNERGRRFSHLSWHNRLKIDKMLKEGYKAQEIADALHVHNSTIYREIKRGLTVQRTSELVDREVYCPDTAQRKYEESKSVHGPDLKIGNDHELAAYIEDKILNGHFSPAAALAKINEEGKIFSVTISEWTLYRYIDKGVFLNITNKDLPMHGERQHRGSTGRDRRAHHFRALGDGLRRLGTRVPQAPAGADGAPHAARDHHAHARRQYRERRARPG